MPKGIPGQRSLEDGPYFGDGYQCWYRPLWRVYDRGVLAVLALGIGLAVVVMAALLPFGIAYDRRLRQQRRPAVSSAADRPRVFWQAGRWDSDPSHAYVANIGADTAYEVSVAVCDRVVGQRRSVSPCRADGMLASSEIPCYVIFCIDHCSDRHVYVDGRAPFGGSDKAVDPDETDVAVQVSWRSENDEWFTQVVHGDGPIPANIRGPALTYAPRKPILRQQDFRLRPVRLSLSRAGTS